MMLGTSATVNSNSTYISLDISFCQFNTKYVIYICVYVTFTIFFELTYTTLRISSGEFKVSDGLSNSQIGNQSLKSMEGSVYLTGKEHMRRHPIEKVFAHLVKFS